MTEEKTGIDISDSVVMGDVQQNILKTECPSCSASNVKVMKCQDEQCTSIQFCELCHINCRYSSGGVLRFDSGKGSGPFCSVCILEKKNKFIHEMALLDLQKSREYSARVEVRDREKKADEITKEKKRQILLKEWRKKTITWVVCSIVLVLIMVSLEYVSCWIWLISLLFLFGWLSIMVTYPHKYDYG